MRRYESYKDSDQQWLGMVPSHWDIKRLGSYFIERKQKVSDKEYEPLSVTKLGVFPQWENVAKTNDGDNRKLVRKGDFVINSRSDRKGSSGISDRDGSVSLINIVLEPRKNIRASFSMYLLKSYAFAEEFYRSGHGIVADLWTTRYEDMKMIKLALPSLSEQDAIVSYLDRVTADIDKAIEQQQRMIDLLNERKQIIIENAVTKGINPNVEFRECKFGWLGKMKFPNHWEIRRFKYCANIKANLVHPSDYLSLPQISPDCIEKNSGILLSYDTVENSGVISDNHLFYKGQIIYSKIRPTLNKAIIAEFDGLCSADMYPIESNNNMQFILYVLLSSYFSQQVQLVVNDRVKMPKINREELGDILIALPPKEEQMKIASYIKLQVESIITAIAKVQQTISSLQERKRIIINDVVTGKIKVS